MGLLLLYAIVAPVAWALCRMSAGQDAEEAQRELVALVPSSRTSGRLATT